MLDLRPSRAARRRGRLRFAVPAVVVLAALLVWGPLDLIGRSDQVAERSGADAGAFPREFEDDAAFEDAPWAENLRLGLLDAWNNLEFNAALGGWRIKDVASEDFNITDGERRTIAPDPALGEPTTVWLLGGSAAFGAGQRDAHTIASELVRRAGDAGVPLEVRNLAVPATVNWQEAMLLMARLGWDEPPDLIVVYDGANDLALQGQLTEQGRGRSDEPASLVDAELDEVLRERADRSGAADGVLPPSATTQPDAAPSPSEAGQLVFSRYSRGVEAIRRMADSAGVPVAFFWQPDLNLKQPLSDADRDTLAELGIEDETVTRSIETSAAARAGLASLGVVDLSSVYDGRDEAIYWDTVHTNELGARIVAESIFSHLEPTIRSLRDARGP